MHLKKLTLRGFKSFASSTSLGFETGITCIVGPNGSGKSNLVDALAWVMGEQGAKSLRGASMEDVIFAGTIRRPPLGRAEISLTIDNSDHALPLDFPMITISRTKFRSGNSEYAINGKSCRLLDIRELLSDSGIGREMHVVVGQGHLDQILQATAEQRRAFIEEAGGVLKHRERKERALRKLESTQANLNRLTDLVQEIRRQLKPLGRQAEVARRASLVQADLRDAKARLLADDLVQAHTKLKDEIRDEAALRARRGQVESELAQARALEDESRREMIDQDAGYRQIQQAWFSLSAVAERVSSIIAIADERIRNADGLPGDNVTEARDPDTLFAQAEKLTQDEAGLRLIITDRAATLEEATAVRVQAEAEHTQAQKRYEAATRAESDRRADIAHLSGEITSLRSRLDSTTQQLIRLEATHALAKEQAEQAVGVYQSAQAELPSLTAGEHDLDAANQAAGLAFDQAKDLAEVVKTRIQSLTETKAGLQARVEALKLGLEAQNDAAAWIASDDGIDGVVAPVASLVQVETGYEAAVAAGLGLAAGAVVVRDLASSIDALAALRANDYGRASLLIADHNATITDLGQAPTPGRWLMSVISGEAAVLAGLAHIVGSVVVVESAKDAPSVLAQMPTASVVTRLGDCLSSWLVTGGSADTGSAIQIGTALGEAETQLDDVSLELVGQEAELASALSSCNLAQAELQESLRALNESDAAQAAALENLSQLNQAVMLADKDVQRLSEQVSQAQKELVKDQLGLAELEDRIAATTDVPEMTATDPGQRDELAQAAKRARSVEMEARLELHSLEERARYLSNQAESLRKAAQSTLAARFEADQRRQVLLAQANLADRVVRAGRWLGMKTAESLHTAETQLTQIGENRDQAEVQAEDAHQQVRDLLDELDVLVDTVHQDELTLTQHRMRIDALTERAMTELSMDPESLMSQYGPDQPIPISGSDQTGDLIEIGYERDEQLKRLRTAERDLGLLGRINPLALEEYDALQTRHEFLAKQLEDLKKTRSDLENIIADVDIRVQEVFASTYTDVAVEFTSTFARLFPGGQGRLILTEPDQWLTTGIEIEARPAGKNIKRLSLLSGGERALVAVCYLIALFKARPSPFYVLDEVEAALDDTNASRLLEVFEELGKVSQLLIITHQKRTMEIADTLYGVTMGSDGTSKVVSQRMREK